MWRCLFCAILSLLAASTLQVEVRDSEIWLVRDGAPRQLTHDGRSKLQAELSPSQDRIAYYEQCPEKEHCTPSVIVLDVAGKRLSSFHPITGSSTSPSPCNSILSIAWTGPNDVAVECHINPSLSEYIITNIATLHVSQDLLGYDFVPSPDGKKIAHVGWIPHFAPPYAQSNYLQVDSTTIYPLLPRPGANPAGNPTEPANAVRHEGANYFDIHDFLYGLSWSPDGSRVALVDCMYNWKETDPAMQKGEEFNRRCSVVAVSTNCKFQSFPLEGLTVKDLYQSHISWTAGNEFTLIGKEFKKRFVIQ